MTTSIVEPMTTASALDVPFHRPALRESDLTRMVETVRSGWLSSGPVGRQFEESLAAALGRHHVVAVSSATAALQLMYRALGVTPGTEVITTPMTFVSTAEVAVHLGARPVFADVEASTGHLSAESVERAITPRTSAIVPVHLGGRLTDLAPLRELADHYGIALIEDAAHALTSRGPDGHVGGASDGAALSFYATKELPLGEGGAVVTDDAWLADQCRTWSLHGMTRSGWTRSRGGRPATYDIETLGYKMNLPDVLAALGVGQVERMEEDREHRARLAAAYDRGLLDVRGVEPLAGDAECESSHHLYVVRVGPDCPIDRDAIAAALRERGVQTSVHFGPLHEMTYFQETWGTHPSDCPEASRLGQEVLSLPIYPDLPVYTVGRIVDAIADIIASAS